ncbi:MAG: phosphotransacetylase, partial [Elusimicrobiota bacterium]|nr:phosphotransacetylase [Elusimicrobiota bacterium]
TKEGIAKVVLPTDDINKLRGFAETNNVDLSGIEIINIDLEILDAELINKFVEARSKKGMSAEDAQKLLTNPLYFAMMYLKNGKCDACVCGAVADTADVLRAGIYVIGAAPGLKLISSYFLMIPPPNHPVAKTPVLFADCGVNPDPDAMGLRDIGISTVASFNKLFPGEIAKVALLSFSTKGSAKAKNLEKIIEATSILQKHFKPREDVFVDGEMQFDAAVVKEIGERKAPGSPVAGQANILIFPDLNSGNIGYKIAQRYGGFCALGPLIQGLDLPVSDLSRGCDADDIYLVSAIMLLK